MPRPLRQEDIARVPSQPTAGRTLVTRRAVFDIVRTATLGSYGVTGFACRPLDRLRWWLGFGHPGMAVHLGETLDIELELTVAYGVPVAEVARQVDSAIRYAVRGALGQEVGRIAIHVDGLHVPADGALPSGPDALPMGIRSRDLADSGTDVA